MKDSNRYLNVSNKVYEYILELENENRDLIGENKDLKRLLKKSESLRKKEEVKKWPRTQKEEENFITLLRM